jgi:hypothetical protein
MVKIENLNFRTQSGLHVTVGDDMGRIWVYDVGEALAIPSQVNNSLKKQFSIFLIENGRDFLI